MQIRGHQTAQRLHNQLNETIDLCFIDASHFYGDGRVTQLGVLPDYKEFAPHCKIVMFHEVLDYDNWISYGDGGVPKFWSDLKAVVEPSRILEFVQQPGIYPPTLGSRDWDRAACSGPHRAPAATSSISMEEAWCHTMVCLAQHQGPATVLICRSLSVAFGFTF